VKKIAGKGKYKKIFLGTLSTDKLIHRKKEKE